MAYILITSDQRSINEIIVPAIEIVKFRLKIGKWPIYERTPFLNNLKKNDNCVMYLAGHNELSQHFINYFEILSINPFPDVENEEKELGIITSKPVKEIIFKQTTVMKPVSVRELLSILDYTSTVTDKSWGAKFMGGVRKLSEEDFNLIAEILNKKN